MSPYDPYEFLKVALKAIPLVRYAIAVATIGAVLAMVRSFELDWLIALIGGGVVFGFMVAMVVFSALTKLRPKALKGQATFLAWAFVILTVVSAFLFASSVFFDLPVRLSDWITPKASRSSSDHMVSSDTQGLRLTRKIETESVYTYWNLPNEDRLFSDDSELRFQQPTDLQAMLYPTNRAPKMAELRGHGGDVRAVAFNPKAKIVATGSEDSSVGLWDLEHRRSLGRIVGFKGTIRALAFSANGKSLAIAGDGSTIFVLGTEHYQSSKRFLILDNSVTRIRSVSFSPDGNMLAAVGSGPTYIWNTINSQLRMQFARLRTWPSYAYGVAFSATRSAFAVGFHGGESTDVNEFVRLWPSLLSSSSLDLVGSNDRMRSSRMLSLTHEEVVGSLQFSPAGNLLARATRAQGPHDRMSIPGGSLLIWDLNKQLERRAYGLPSGRFYSICFYGDTNLLVVTADGKPDVVGGAPWDSATVSPVISVWDSSFEGSHAFETDHASGVGACFFSHDCQFLATSGVDSPNVSLWDVKALKLEAKAQTESNMSQLMTAIEEALEDTPRFGPADQELWNTWLKEVLLQNPQIRSIRELKELRWSARHPTIRFVLNGLDD